MTQKLDLTQVKNAYFTGLADRIDIGHPDINLTANFLAIRTGILDSVGDEITLYLKPEKEGYLLTDDGYVIFDLDSTADFNPEQFEIDTIKPVPDLDFKYNKKTHSIELRFKFLDDILIMEDMFKQMVVTLQTIVLMGNQKNEKSADKKTE